MKQKKFFIATGLFLLVLSGCIPSIHGLYTDDDLVFKETLLGKWIDGSEATWSFTASGDKAYSLDYTEDEILGDDQKVSGNFQVHLVKLGEYYFLDLFPGNNDQLKMPSLLINTFLPVHIFAKVEFKGEEVIINFFDPDHLQDLLDEGRIRIGYEKTDDFIVLTASTEELQKFVIKYADDENAFLDSTTLKRL